MKRVMSLACAAFFAASPFAFAQDRPDPGVAPVGHRQPTPSGLAAPATPPTVDPNFTGRSATRGDSAKRDGAADTGPRICTNCND